MQNNTSQEIWNAIFNSNRLLSILDGRFDLDSFSSIFVLKSVLSRLGKDVDIIYGQSVKDEAKKYYDVSSIEQEVDLITYDYSKYDAIVIMDCSGLHHLNAAFDEIKFPESIKVVNIDHHATNTFYGNLNFVYPVASACSLLYKILQENNIKITAEEGKLLLLGLLTDSGFLQFDTAMASDFRIISELIDLGVDYFGTVWNLTYNETLDTLKFKGLIYRNFVLDKQNKYAYSYYTNKQLSDLGIIRDRVTTPACDLIRREEDIDFAFTISEDPDVAKRYWLSFRARVKGTNVLKLSQMVGKGGGHEMASGCQIEGFDSIEDGIKFIKDKITEFRKLS